MKSLCFIRHVCKVLCLPSWAQWHTALHEWIVYAEKWQLKGPVASLYLYSSLRHGGEYSEVNTGSKLASALLSAFVFCLKERKFLQKRDTVSATCNTTCNTEAVAVRCLGMERPRVATASLLWFSCPNVCSWIQSWGSIWQPSLSALLPHNQSVCWIKCWKVKDWRHTLDHGRLKKKKSSMQWVILDWILVLVRWLGTF